MVLSNNLFIIYAFFFFPKRNHKQLHPLSVQVQGKEPNQNLKSTIDLLATGCH